MSRVVAEPTHAHSADRAQLAARASGLAIPHNLRRMILTA